MTPCSADKLVVLLQDLGIPDTRHVTPYKVIKISFIYAIYIKDANAFLATKYCVDFIRPLVDAQFNSNTIWKRLANLCHVGVYRQVGHIKPDCKMRNI